MIERLLFSPFSDAGTFFCPSLSCSVVCASYCFFYLFVWSLAFGFDSCYISFPAPELPMSLSTSSLSEYQHASPGSEPFLGVSQRTLTISIVIHHCFSQDFARDCVVSAFIDQGDITQIHSAFLSSESAGNHPLPRDNNQRAFGSLVILQSDLISTSPTNSRHKHCTFELPKRSIGFWLLGSSQFRPLFSSWAIDRSGGPSPPTFMLRSILPISSVNLLLLLNRYVWCVNFYILFVLKTFCR